MMECIQIYGYDLIYRKNNDVWVACFGPDYFVHFYQPPGCCWSAKKPFALEPIATGKTLALCVHNALKHYEILKAQARESAARKLADPIVQKAIMQRESIR
jgi:hypothetical protein